MTFGEKILEAYGRKYISVWLAGEDDGVFGWVEGSCEEWLTLRLAKWPHRRLLNPAHIQQVCEATASPSVLGFCELCQKGLKAGGEWQHLGKCDCECHESIPSYARKQGEAI